MVNLIAIAVSTIIVTIVGGLLGWWIWIATRPKKLSWKANVYQRTNNKLAPIKNGKGEIIQDLDLSDLRPLCKDILQKEEHVDGKTTYSLVKLHKGSTECNEDCVDTWPDGSKEVHVLLEGEVVTVLRKGYDNVGGVIFNPMAFDRVNMISTNIITKKSRLREKKDVLTAITPFIVAGIWVFGMIFITYLITSTYVDIDKISDETMRYVADKGVESAKLYKDALYNIGMVAKLPPELINNTAGS